MKQEILIALTNGPLPIPHLLQWPDYSEPNIYSAIIPKDMEFNEGDLFTKGYGLDLKVVSILERRTAKGDWSRQKNHVNPDYIKFLTK